MYSKEVKEYLQGQIRSIKESGLYKEERVIYSPQGPRIRVKEGEVLNFCANNYLGLADDPELIAVAKKALDERGHGLSSVRFICGTQDIHKELERKISEFLRTEDTILYSSCAAANEGLFEVLLGPEDVLISDQLNHATIIDGVRLWGMVHKKRLGSGSIEFPENRVMKHSDMADLENHLKETQDRRFRMIATDGVFSMDGDVARLKEICDLAERYSALVMVDDSHATGFFGPGGRGTPEYCGVEERVDVITSTLGKALGGATGGFTSGRTEMVELLRQRSRPYLFSNTLAPSIVATGIKVLEIVGQASDLRKRLEENTVYFRTQITKLGFVIKPGSHPIVPIMLYDAKKATQMAEMLLTEGIYVIAFSYPVVPRGQARIRVQISAAHSKEDVTFALQKFAEVGRQLGVIA
ncbi:MAG: glycine C-acetyltransferase [Chloroflexi bacterium RBG_13_51_36]|nr:MAG: glycine C-acetyltransferase [Chloroflexi bacterium RBG_13_51_36]